MSTRRITLRAGSHEREAATDTLNQAFETIRAELSVPADFPPQCLVEADEAAARGPRPGRDETAVPFFTVDPPGSTDLDQAMALEKTASGYRVRYAIADVPSVVGPGGALDTEGRRRGETTYLPDGRTPLWPPVLSEAAASLLPGQTRSAFLWDLRLDRDADLVAVDVYRAVVRSRSRLDYESVQKGIEAGEAQADVALLKEIGERRIRLEHDRGGASLPKPEQEIVAIDGTYELRFRPVVPAEDWNAQISLMTGMAAADLMLHAEVGILRTMPEPDPGAVTKFRRQAKALGAAWPAETLYGDFLRTLDRSDPAHVALMHMATKLFRGAGYTPFEGTIPEAPEHAAVAAPYAHVTAPLRRYVDRFALVVCEAISAGTDVPGWARMALPALPGVMAESNRRSSAADRAAADAAEAAVLAGRVGEVFTVTVVEDRGRGKLSIQLTDPAVEATCLGTAAVGTQIQARLARADVAARAVEFEVA